MSGRWDRGEYVWECPGCGCVRCSSQAPGEAEAKCLRCRHGDASKDIGALVDKLDNERAEWMARARKAERESEKKDDEINELRDRLRELEGRAA